MFRLQLNLFLIVVSVITLTSCEFKDVKLENVQDFEVNSLRGGKLDATINLVLSNPNSFPITVKSGEFELFSGKKSLGDAQLKKAFKINANSTEVYPVQLTGNMGDMITAGLTGLAGLLSGKKPEVLVKGELKVGNFFIHKKVPIEIKTELPMSF
jgi:LEA14-like dessication related protein